MALAPQSRAGEQSEPQRTPRRPFPRSSPRPDRLLPSVRRPSVPTLGALRPSPHRRAAFPAPPLGVAEAAASLAAENEAASPQPRTSARSPDLPRRRPRQAGRGTAPGGRGQSPPRQASLQPPLGMRLRLHTRPDPAWPAHCPGSLSPTC
ncbi:unnamed protein product [Rangifer tarandus platyrhynchus]|uniref:Uncharacterized protein n=1 Tax=Rangifer tarandus platyrhynchus TaxID=3082113 RepID=A0ABN8Y257_RANTA|nr:unnamed protein product [Rangifer tarandus platyrhynchus]CAI9155692.1 unnamed protein product [Rangifer tarandus platyrhynchus]CAI9155700.1 unnamed protein product [Rangifer tarandus platyrhynchus]CAI9155710.1 unnamed protein product [Rangifer tarandus platyrhynchus]CAI9155730.1 unnamed protein product [Rangifer tarandus platyrhynchus]